jgi:hypothetical protein
MIDTLLFITSLSSSPFQYFTIELDCPHIPVFMLIFCKWNNLLLYVLLNFSMSGSFTHVSRINLIIT